MAYHLPLHETWRPHDLASAFHDLGIECSVDDDRVLAVIPILEFPMDPNEITAATTLEEMTPKRVGETNATLSLSENTSIENISVKFSHDMLSSSRRYPDYGYISEALKTCGYICSTEREIVQVYLPNDTDAMELMDEIADLQNQKEECILNTDFEGAKHVLQKQRKLQDIIENRVRDSSTNGE